jgi:sodium/potassium-transporting ATPase subunit alpha
MGLESLLAVAILGVLFVNGIFSFWQEYRAERATAALRWLLPQQARRCGTARVMQAGVGALVPGDVILLDGRG